jgi:hypothetical protein
MIYSKDSAHPTKKPGKNPSAHRVRPKAPANGKAEVVSHAAHIKHI